MTLRGWLAPTALAGFVIAGATVIACGVDSKDAGGVPPVSKLESATGASWIVDLHPRFGTVRFAKPRAKTRSITQGSPDTVAAARKLLEDNANDLKIDLAGAVAEPVVVDRRGGSHITFTQKVEGVAVRGGRVTVHLAKDGSVSYVNGLWAPSAGSVGTTPAIDEAAAIAAAKAHVKGMHPKLKDASIKPRAPKLAIEIDHAGHVTLVHELVVPLPAIAEELRILVDAKTGKVLRTMNELVRVAAWGKGVRAYATDGRKDENDLKGFEVEQNGTDFVMRRPAAAGATELNILKFGTNAGARNDTPFTSTNADEWDTTGNGPGSAVDAFVNMAKVDTYFSTLGRSSYDNAGSKLEVVVHQWDDSNNDGKYDANDDEFMCNAYFSMNDKFMAFGDGDWKKTGGTLGCMPLGGMIDVAAHEYTHAIVNSDMGLEYDNTDSGALHESFADIFGNLVERFYFPDDAKNVQMGEEGLLGSMLTPLRDMATPTNGKEATISGKVAPDHMTKRTDMEAHLSSNIPSHAFYLMTVGGRNATSNIEVTAPIGWDRAQQLYYAVLTTSKPSSKATFEDIAKATIAEAENQAIEKAPVVCAWVAVGVITEDKAKNDFATTCRCDSDAGADAGCNAVAEDAGTDVQVRDSCIGRADGFYCSEVTPSSGFWCATQQVAYGLQCVDTTKRCRGAKGAYEIDCN